MFTDIQMFNMCLLVYVIIYGLFTAQGFITQISAYITNERIFVPKVRKAMDLTWLISVVYLMSLI